MGSKVAISVRWADTPASWNIPRAKLRVHAKHHGILAESSLESGASLCNSYSFIEPNVFLWESINW